MKTVNLNGRECRWKSEMFELFGIEPYVGYTKRVMRDAWERQLKPDYEVKCRRGKGGVLERVS